MSDERASMATQARQDHVDPIRLPLLEMVTAGELPVTSPHDCPYLSGRDAQSEGFSARHMHAETYRELMEMGFRRSGRIFYRPQCPSCDACVPLRIPVDEFTPSKSQRRAIRRNADLTVKVDSPRITHEKIELYRRYLEYQHPGSSQTDNPEGVDEFLYDPVVDSLEVEYRRPGGRLIGVSIVDVSSVAVSCVYHYFEPDEARRSLGVFSILHEINLTRQWRRPHYYLGYWIAGCATMDYKANYRPHELFIDGQWKRRD